MAEFYKAKFLFVTHGKQQMDPTVIQGSLRMTGTYKLKASALFCVGKALSPPGCEW